MKNILVIQPSNLLAHVITQIDPRENLLSERSLSIIVHGTVLLRGIYGHIDWNMAI